VFSSQLKYQRHWVDLSLLPNPMDQQASRDGALDTEIMWRRLISSSKEELLQVQFVI
jgi:hypothetical protein